MWAVYAILSALFASLTAILGKIGVQNINSNLATAIRTIFVLMMAWGMVFITGSFSGVKDIGSKSMIFLALSGIATGASWLCYYKAMQMGQIAKVVTIDKFSLVLTFLLAALFLGEKLNFKTVLGGILITIGTLIVAL
ncbi:MAG: EamA family transporter [Ruthenibacterium sp.]